MLYTKAGIGKSGDKKGHDHRESHAESNIRKNLKLTKKAQDLRQMEPPRSCDLRQGRVRGTRNLSLGTLGEYL